MGRKSSKQIRRDEKARRKETQSADQKIVRDAPGLLVLALVVVLAVLTCIAYANSFEGKFVYDDTKWVQQMSVDRIKNPIKSIMRARRPVVDATLSMNYSFAEMEPAPRAMTVREIPSPWGYHLVNLAVHILAGLTLFGLVRRSIHVGPFRDAVKASAHWIAFSVAMLWLLHPLQTQSVTYIIQRAESMMGLFYLLTLYCLVRHATMRDGPRKIAWLVAAIVAAMLGMGSKGVMVTVPIVALVYDRVFLAGSWQEVVKKRWPVHTGIACSLIMLGLSGVLQGVLLPPSASKARRATVGFGLTSKSHEYHVSSSEYLLTEAKVIPRYLKLSVLPTDQALDYKMEKVDPSALSAGELFTQSLLPGLFVLALLGATIYGLIRIPWLGFIGVWFFVILAPTSTFIPIRDPIYEHRMYLSLAAVMALFVIGVWTLLSRMRGQSEQGAAIGPICAGICLLPAIALMILTIQRNALYQDPLRLWEDNIQIVPDNWRARNNLAKQYLDEADQHPEYVDKAIEHLKFAVDIYPEFVNGWYNLGNAYSRKKDYDNAIDAYQNALKKNPVYTVAHIMLGNAHTDKGNAMLSESITDIKTRKRRIQEGVASLELAAEAFKRAAPTANRNSTNDRTLRARAYYNLGNTYMRLARFNTKDPSLTADARSAYEKAIKALPSHPSARVGIGLTYVGEANRMASAGQSQKAKHARLAAIEQFQQSLKFDPPANETLIALMNMGDTHMKLGAYSDASNAFRQATERFQKNPNAWYQLSVALEKNNSPTDALDVAKKGAEIVQNSRRLYQRVQQLAARLGASADQNWAKQQIQRLEESKR